MLVLQNIISEELYSENEKIVEFNTLDEALEFRDRQPVFIQTKYKVVEVKND